MQAIGYPLDVSTVETILVFVALPLAIYAAIGLVTLRSKFSSSARYRPGQEWNHAPVWWAANPGGLATTHGHSASNAPATPGGARVRGGASGSW